MHNTLDPRIKFNLDTVSRNNDEYFLKGWVLHLDKLVNTLRVEDPDTVSTEKYKLGGFPFNCSTYHDRPDVYAVYPNTPTGVVGFEMSFKCKEEIKNFKFSCDIENSNIVIATIKNPLYAPNKPNIKINSNHPSIMAVDDFYSNPDEVRDYALSLEFNYHKKYHKGQRTEVKTFFDGTTEFLEDALKKKITSWDHQPHNGVFQYCTAQDQLVYHTDSQTYAAVVFLTPDAPPAAGTTFFQHKGNGLKRKPTKEDCIRLGKSVDELMWDMFEGNFYDKTPWETVDVIGNVYNRLALWDAKLVHAASQYFGDKKENGRLFHMFFFDAE